VSDVELPNGVPVFLDQLVAALRIPQGTDALDLDAIRRSARRNGDDLLGMGLTIAQVVHDYGDVCQVVTELAVGQAASIPSNEFQTLNLCLDVAIAEAVTAYSTQSQSRITDEGTERLGMLAHELRNLLNTAMLSFESIRRGRVAVGGSTSLLHERSVSRTSGWWSCSRMSRSVPVPRRRGATPR
jgi:hypothetical protein